MKKQLITGVVHNTTNKIIDDICAFNQWVENFRVIGKIHLYAQIYFQVHAVEPWRILIDEGKEIFREHNLSILLKCTKAKGWNRKLGILLGPRAEVASLKEYKNKLVEYCEIDISYFELKKKVEKEGDTSAKYIVVYAVESKAEEMDLKL